MGQTCMGWAPCMPAPSCSVAAVPPACSCACRACRVSLPGRACLWCTGGWEDTSSGSLSDAAALLWAWWCSCVKLLIRLLLLAAGASAAAWCLTLCSCSQGFRRGRGQADELACTGMCWTRVNHNRRDMLTIVTTTGQAQAHTGRCTLTVPI